ncbi:tetratricopeptide repeat protein [Planctomycetota bacterium]
MEQRRPARWPILVAVAALVLLVSAVFWPIPGFEFVDLDVDQQVLHNPHIQGVTWANLKHIFTSRCLTSYYPIRTLSLAVDHHFWGLDPTGFKLTNGLLHLANVLLVFWLVLRLLRYPAAADGAPSTWRDVCLAMFSSGIFAVHPVVVEPVVWVAGREELLMVLGALGCVHFHMTARRLGEEGARPRWALVCHGCAALCCAAACLSNAVAAVIPLLIVAWDVLTLTGPKLWRILSGTAALWVIGAATVVIKVSYQAMWTLDRFGIRPVVDEPAVFSVERLTMIANLYWLNLKTLFWPTNLAVHYAPARPEGFVDAGVILGGAAIGLTCAVLWCLRRRKLVLLGLVWLGLALAPASQIMPHHIHRADRFLYLPLVGLVLAVAMGFKPLVNALKGRGQVAVAVASGVVGLLLLVWLSTGQVETWRDKLSLWEHCVSVDPDNALAQDALGSVFRKRGQMRQAMQHYQRAMELDYNNDKALHLFALQLATCEDPRLRNYDEAIRLAERACELSKWQDSRYLGGLATVCTISADGLAAGGRFGPAIDNYRRALELDPKLDLALYNLAWLLATCSEEELRRPGEAVRLAQEAYELTEDPAAQHLEIVAVVYAAAGRFREAVAAAEKAVQLAEAAGNWPYADQLRSRLESFREQSLSESSSQVK